MSDEFFKSYIDGIEGREEGKIIEDDPFIGFLNKKIINNQKDDSFLKGLLSYMEDEKNGVSPETQKKVRSYVDQVLAANEESAQTVDSRGNVEPLPEIPSKKDMEGWTAASDASIAKPIANDFYGSYVSRIEGREEGKTVEDDPLVNYFNKEIVNNQQSDSFLKGILSYMEDEKNGVSPETQEKVKSYINQVLAANEETARTVDSKGNESPLTEIPSEKDMENWEEMSSESIVKHMKNLGYPLTPAKEEKDREDAHETPAPSEKDASREDAHAAPAPSGKGASKDPDEEEVNLEGENPVLEGGAESHNWDEYRTAWNQAYSHRRGWDEKGEVGEHDVSDVKRPLNKGGYRLLRNQTVDGEEVMVAKTGVFLQHKAVIHANGQVDFGNSTNKKSIHVAIEMKLRMGQDIVILSGGKKFRDAVEVELYKIANDKGVSPEVSERAQSSLDNIWKEKDKELLSKLHDDYVHGGPIKKARVLRELKGYGIVGKDGKNVTDEDMAAAGGVDAYFEQLAAEDHGISKAAFYKKHPILTGKGPKDGNALGSDETEEFAAEEDKDAKDKDAKDKDTKDKDAKDKDAKDKDAKDKDAKDKDAKDKDAKDKDAKDKDAKDKDAKDKDAKDKDAKGRGVDGKGVGSVSKGIPHGEDDLKELANRYVSDLASDARGDDKSKRQLSEQDKQWLDNLITGKDGNPGDANKFSEVVNMVIANTVGQEHKDAKRGLRDVKKRAKDDKRQEEKAERKEKIEDMLVSAKENIKGMAHAAGRGAATVGKGIGKGVSAAVDFVAKGHSKESERLANLAKRIRGSRES